MNASHSCIFASIIAKYGRKFKFLETVYSGRIRFLREKNRRAALFCCGGGRIVLQ